MCTFWTNPKLCGMQNFGNLLFLNCMRRHLLNTTILVVVCFSSFMGIFMVLCCLVLFIICGARCSSKSYPAIL